MPKGHNVEQYTLPKTALTRMIKKHTITVLADKSMKICPNSSLERKVNAAPPMPKVPIVMNTITKEEIILLSNTYTLNLNL
jgi:hypothetical protein